MRKKKLASKRLWDRRVWEYPLQHDFVFGFGLDIDDTAATKNSTIVPLLLQDNAIIDYETKKVNPENEDFAVTAKPNTAAGSYVPRLMVSWKAWSPSVEIDVMNFKTMQIATSMLNRLDAFDKKTGTDVEAIIGLTHETTDEQAYPLFNNTKLYEGHSVRDYATDVPGLTTTQQPEGIAFNIEQFFDANHYYTNKEMLRKITGRMKNHYINGPLSSNRRTFEKVAIGYSNMMPSICKYQHPYTFCGLMFTCGQAGSKTQMAKTADVTAIEHLTIQGRVRFNEYNPDWNFSRA